MFSLASQLLLRFARNIEKVTANIFVKFRRDRSCVTSRPGVTKSLTLLIVYSNKSSRQSYVVERKMKNSDETLCDVIDVTLTVSEVFFWRVNHETFKY